MYERLVIPAIQHGDVKDFETRYRRYKTVKERDTTFDALQAHKPDASMVRVTLIITVETVNEQQSFDI